MWQNFQRLQCFQMLQILLRPKECYKLSNVADIAEFSRMLRMLLGLKKKNKFITMFQILQFVADVAELFTKEGATKCCKVFKECRE